MNSKASAAYRGKLNSPRFFMRNPQASVAQAVMANDPRPRDPLAYPSARPRPERAARPRLSLVWSEAGVAAPVAPAAAVPVAAPAPMAARTQTVVATVEAELVVVESGKADAVPQRMHLLRPMGAVSPSGKAVYITSAFQQKRA